MTKSKRSRRRAGRKALSARDAEVAKLGRALSARDAEVAKLGRALSARDAEVAKLGKENGELKEENKKLKEQACEKAHGGGPCPYGEENKRLKEDLVQARKINSAVSAKLIRAKPNVRAKKGEAKKGEAKKGEAKKGEAKKGEAKKGEAKKGEAKKGEAKKGEAKKGEAKKGEAKKRGGAWKICEEPDRIVEVDPRACQDCGCELAGIEGRCSRTVKRLKIGTENVRYDKVKRRCPRCNKVHTPRTPGAMPGCRHDLNTQMAAVSLKMCGMSYRNIADIFRTVLGIDVAAGTIVKMVGRAARALEPLHAAMAGMLREAKAINGDETSWRINGANAWLWVLVAERFAVFKVEYSRGASVLLSLLDGFKGTMTSDSHPPYNHVGDSHQKCHVHYLREVKETLELKDPGPQFRRFARTFKKMLHDSHEVAACADPEERKRGAARLLARLDRLISKDYDEPNCKRFVKRLKRERDHAFTFIMAGIPSDNNRAERALRLSVIIRNITGGSRSRKGARGHAVLMSVKETCRMNGLNFYEFCVKYLDRGSPEASRRAAAGPAPGGEAWPFPEPADADADAGKTASKS